MTGPAVSDLARFFVVYNLCWLYRSLIGQHLMLSVHRTPNPSVVTLIAVAVVQKFRQSVSSLIRNVTSYTELSQAVISPDTLCPRRCCTTVG
jgi:hypothetical protein